MSLSRRTLLGATTIAPITSPARAQGTRSTAPLKIGVLNDRSGPYRGNTGMGSVQAGCYAGTMHYLKAVQAMGAAAAKADGAAVVARMKSIPVDDTVFGHGSIRADGRALFPAYLLKAKAPSAIQGKWDVLDLVATTPADQAWRPLAEGQCALVKS